MNRIKCATFNKEIQDSIPPEIREKMKADRVKAKKEQETKAKTLPIQRVSKSYCSCEKPKYNYPEMVWCDNCGLEIKH